MLSGLRGLLAKEEVRAISRRYFVSNGFDGTLTCIGVVIGAVLSGVPSGLVVIKIGLGAAIGLGTSAVWSVWEIERAETRAEVLRMERAMLRDLDGTLIERQHEGERLLHALASGLGPTVGVLLPLSPFLLEGVVLTMAEAAVVSVAIGVGILGTFGAYMGSISGQRWYVAAARMGAAGLVVAALNVLLPG
jgi:predicted membrane protein (TIGR00267 family)